MSKLNTQPRKFHTKQSMVTIVDPRVDIHHQSFTGFIRSDFIDVPRLSTNGEWPISYMLPDEQLVHLAVMANHLKPAQPKSDRKTYAQRFEEKRQKQVKASKERRNVA